MLKIGYIYKTTNKITNKSYIGKTINFKSRKVGHIRCAKKNVSGYFYDSIRKYGPQNFEWNILFKDYCHPNKLNELEKFFIAYYETQAPNGYNLTNGGDGGDTLGNHPNKKNIYAYRNCSHLSDPNKIKKRIKKRIQTISKMNKYDKPARKKANRFLLVDPNGNEYHLDPLKNYTIREFCNKHNLTFSRMWYFINKGKIPLVNNSLSKNSNSINCTGWEIMKYFI